MNAQCQSSVYVVDDDDAFRSSAMSILGAAALTVAGYATAHAFLRAFAPTEPACALIDLEMCDMDALSILASLQEKADWLPVIYTTSASNLQPVTAVMRAGAWQVLEKPIAPATLLETVNQAFQHAVQFHKYATARSEIDVRMSSLSNREREILDLLIQGHSSREIATKLGNSPFTVDKQRSNLMHKLQAKTLPELAMMYYIADRVGRHSRIPGSFWGAYERDTRRMSAAESNPSERASSIAPPRLASNESPHSLSNNAGVGEN